MTPFQLWFYKVLRNFNKGNESSSLTYKVKNRNKIPMQVLVSGFYIFTGNLRKLNRI
jgi:hypothetical protein